MLIATMGLWEGSVALLAKGMCSPSSDSLLQRRSTVLAVLLYSLLGMGRIPK